MATPPPANSTVLEKMSIPLGIGREGILSGIARVYQAAEQQKTWRVMELHFRAGEPLLATVQRPATPDEVIQSAWHVLHNTAEIRPWEPEPGDGVMKIFLSAMRSLYESGQRFRFVVAPSRGAVNRWLFPSGAFELDRDLNIPIHEDDAAPGIFLCGASQGNLLPQVELAYRLVAV